MDDDTSVSQQPFLIFTEADKMVDELDDVIIKLHNIIQPDK